MTTEGWLEKDKTERFILEGPSLAVTPAFQRPLPPVECVTRCVLVLEARLAASTSHKSTRCQSDKRLPGRTVPEVGKVQGGGTAGGEAQWKVVKRRWR